jgi:non-ribosomal peptide synthetase component E (peptide arylation enzyme)
LTTGSQIFTAAIFDPERTPLALQAARLTLAGSGVPYVPHYLRHQAAHPDQLFFPESRGYLVGGAPRPAALHHEVKNRLGGVGMISGYGMTECPYLSWGRADDPDDKLIESEGRPSAGTTLLITDPDGVPVPAGESGELRIKAPQLMLGYVDKALDADAFDVDGFFRTGDLARIDADGYIFITGRLKDVIIRNMENISAREVESAAIGFGPAADFTAIGLPDALTGERVCAVVVPADASAPPTLDDLTAFLRAEGLNPRKLPVQLELVPELPRNAMGKILKANLKARFTASH